MSEKFWGFLFFFTAILFLTQPAPSLALASGQTETRNDESDPLFFEHTEESNTPKVLLDDLETELDVGLGYCFLTGEGIEEQYKGMIQGGVSVSFLIAPQVRTFFRLDYTSASGDPYKDTLGFEHSADMKIKSVPLTFGLKYNASKNQRIRVQLGIGIQAAWQQEETIRVRNGNEIGTGKASAFNFGFAGTFGPEFFLGDSGNLLGFEFGFGGAKGSLDGDGYSVAVDLSGFTTRTYFIIAL